MRRHSPSRLVALLAAAGLLSMGMGGTAAASASPRHVSTGERSVLSAAEVTRLSADATHRSIVIFKNELSGLPASGATASARIAAANAAQAVVLTELRQVHASHVTSLHIIDAIAATVSSAEASRLADNPAVSAVVPDAVWHFASLGSGPGAASPVGVRPGHHGLAANAAPQQVCPANPNAPLIEPESHQVMDVAPADQIANGSGVRVGIIADGIDPDNPDLIRPNGQHVIFDYEDFTGDVWAQTVNPNATYTPLTLAPGKTGTITLTFTPSAPRGTVIRGFIGVDTFNSFTLAGDELVNIPYTYRVG